MHKVIGYAFSNGELRSVAITELEVRKSGTEEFIHKVVQENGLLCGLFTVFLAMFAGWLASVIFRKK